MYEVGTAPSQQWILVLDCRSYSSTEQHSGIDNHPQFYCYTFYFIPLILIFVAWTVWRSEWVILRERYIVSVSSYAKWCTGKSSCTPSSPTLYTEWGSLVKGPLLTFRLSPEMKCICCWSCNRPCCHRCPIFIHPERFHPSQFTFKRSTSTRTWARSHQSHP